MRKERVITGRRAPKREDFDVLPRTISIKASAGAIELHVNVVRLFNAFAVYFDGVLATSARHPNYESTIAAEVASGVSRNDAVAHAAAKNVTAVRVYAFEALRRFMTDASALEQLFTVAFETVAARTRTELRGTAVIDDEYVTMFADHTNAEMRSKLVERGLKHLREAWKVSSGGDRRSKVSAGEVPTLLASVPRYRDLWAEIKMASTGLTASAALEVAANVAARHNLSPRERKFVGPLTKLLASPRGQSADKKPQALAVLHAALALDLESSDVLRDFERLKVLPSRWNRRYDRLKKARPSDDNQEFS